MKWINKIKNLLGKWESHQLNTAENVELMGEEKDFWSIKVGPWEWDVQHFRHCLRTHDMVQGLSAYCL